MVSQRELLYILPILFLFAFIAEVSVDVIIAVVEITGILISQLYHWFIYQVTEYQYAFIAASLITSAIIIESILSGDPHSMDRGVVAVQLACNLLALGPFIIANIEKAFNALMEMESGVFSSPIVTYLGWFMACVGLCIYAWIWRAGVEHPVPACFEDYQAYQSDYPTFVNEKVELAEERDAATEIETPESVHSVRQKRSVDPWLLDDRLKGLGAQSSSGGTRRSSDLLTPNFTLAELRMHEPSHFLPSSLNASFTSPVEESYDKVLD